MFSKWKDLLAGYHVLKREQKAPVKRRSVPAVNNYMNIIAGMFQFAADSGYIKENPFVAISQLKRSRTEPDPLTHDEFAKLINAFKHQQLKICGRWLFIREFVTGSWFL